MPHRWRILAYFLLVPCGEAAAQVVRGVVREAGTGAPLAGVVVTLHDAQGVATRQSLSDARGEYAISAAGPGQYVVSAKRIGVRRLASPAFPLAAGEARPLDITLDVVRPVLPAVRVTAESPCATDPSERARVAALWEEARTALEASALSLRDRRMRATITTYERTLTPRTLSILAESRRTRIGVSERAFASPPAESLAALGYARALLEGETYEVFAPDERTLLSEPFVRGHCFALATTSGDSLTGLAFEPVRGRRVSDIRGTIWLDARSFELRMLDFRYTAFPLPADDTLAGGEVHFARRPDGAWHVARWFIRTPRLEPRPEADDLPRGSRAALRPVHAGYRVEGGIAVVSDGVSGVDLATVRGRVTDSTGAAPLEGATVRIGGTSLAARTGSRGQYRIDSVPAGRHPLIVEHPDYAPLGVPAAERWVSLASAASVDVTLDARDHRRTAALLCEGSRDGGDGIVLRLVRRDSSSDAPLPGRPLHVSWEARSRVGPGTVRTVSRSADVHTDAAGGVTFCAMPAVAAIVVEEATPDGTTPYQWVVRTPRVGLLLATLRR